MLFTKDDAEFKILENQNKVLCAMYDQEKNDVASLSRDIKEEIAKTTQL